MASTIFFQLSQAKSDELLPSLVVGHVSHTFTFTSSLLKPLNHLARVVPYHNIIQHPRPPFKMAAVTKHRNFFNCILLHFFINQNQLQPRGIAQFNRTSFYFSRFIPVKDIMKTKSHQNLVLKNLAEMMFGWLSFKTICDTTIFYKLQKSK